MTRLRPGNPLIPGNKQDRTGTAGILRRAAAEIRRRFAGLEAEVVAVFKRVPVYSINDTRPDRVLYGMTPEQLSRLSAELQAAIERWIAFGRDPANSFWWSRYVAEAQQLGTAQAAANLAQLSATYAAQRSLEAIVFSEPYRNRLGVAQVKSYEHWTGQGAEVKQRLSTLIGRAVVDGKSPRAVVTEIAEALGVSRSKAFQFAQTDITDTLRQAKIAEDAAADTELGIKTGLLWTSAFLPTTRPWHASRSGRVYTREEVQDFYGRDGNRYNCACSVTTCLLDADGKPILTKKLQNTMANERKAWQSGARWRTTGPAGR